MTTKGKLVFLGSLCITSIIVYKVHDFQKEERIVSLIYLTN